MKMYLTRKDTSGFALLEVLVAMTILALVGLMAWHGMDAMIRGSEVIEHRSGLDRQYMRLVQQFDRDCHEILSIQEMDSLPLVYGKTNVWFMRHYLVDGRDAWLLVAYVMSPMGLQRITSSPLLERSHVTTLWAGIARDPDLIPSDLRVSFQLNDIFQQKFIVSQRENSSPLDMPNGLIMQWLVRGYSFPIIRSCLLGGSL